LTCQAVIVKGLAYSLTYFIAVIIEQLFSSSENDSKLKDWINFGIYSKTYFRILGLGLGIGLGIVALALGLWPWPWP